MTDWSNLSKEAARFLAANPAVSHLDAFLIDLSGNAFGKRYQASEIEAIFAKGSSMCAAMQLTDVNGECWDVAGLGFSDGDPDGPTAPVPGTLSIVPWADAPRAQCLMRLFEADGSTPLWYDPRTVLDSVLARFSELKLTPVVAIELEFYLIDRERDEDGAPQAPTNPRTGRAAAGGKVFGMEEIEAFGEVVSAIETACKLPRPCR